MAKITNHIARAIQENKIWIISMVITGLVAIIVDFRWNQRERINPDQPAPATYIPDGFVLVPIEVQNPEALDSILGQYGVVDLFAASLPGSTRAQKIASRIKILRAPLNPNHFAVLAPESEAPRIVQQPGPLNVVVQNPASVGTNFVIPKSIKPGRIYVENP